MAAPSDWWPEMIVNKFSSVNLHSIIFNLNAACKQMYSFRQIYIMKFYLYLFRLFNSPARK